MLKIGNCCWKTNTVTSHLVGMLFQPEYAVPVNNVCFICKIWCVLPGVTVFSCRYIGAVFIILSICIIATTLVPWDTLHGGFLQKWPFRWTSWIATLKRKWERAEIWRWRINPIKILDIAVHFLKKNFPDDHIIYSLDSHPKVLLKQ